MPPTRIPRPRNPRGPPWNSSVCVSAARVWLWLDEPKLGKMLRDVMDLRKNLIIAEATLVQQEKNAADIKKQLTALLALNVNLNSQLANLRPGDTTTNNRLVGTINANRSQIELLRNSLQQQAEAVKTARTAANDTREAFIQAILNMRATADSLSQQYAKLIESGRGEVGRKAVECGQRKIAGTGRVEKLPSAPHATQVAWKTRFCPRRFRCDVSAVAR